ncbi:MAG: HAD-IA family hydrolase [Planctomycetota bacterium]
MNRHTDTVVCFDLGGVVLRICRSINEAIERAGLEQRDHERDVSQHEQTVHAHQTGRLSCAEYYEAISAEFGGVYTPEEIELAHFLWIIEDYAGIATVVEELNNTAGVRTACLSNTSDSHWKSMQGIERIDHHAHAGPSEAIACIQHKLVSHELGVMKPNERIYELAEEKLDVRPEQIVFFDDVQENVETAHARGWRARRINPEDETSVQVRTYLTNEIGVLSGSPKSC